MKLWLDDERDPDQAVIQNKFGSESGMFWVKTAWSAISRLKDGNVTFISLDHDLGPASAGTGYDVAKWIEENASSLEPIVWRCHSLNPIGKKNIKAAMKSAERFWESRSKSRQKLLEMIEIEDSCPSFSVGGLAFDLGFLGDKMENLLSTLKTQIFDAMKSKDTVKKDVLRVVVSEVEALQNTTNQGTKPVSDEQIYNIIRKIIVSNNLNLSKTDIISDDLAAKLNTENAILSALVPTLLTVDQIVVELEPIIQQIKDAEKDSQSIGAAMKLLKANKAPVNGDDVKLAISKIRGN